MGVPCDIGGVLGLCTVESYTHVPLRASTCLALVQSPEQPGTNVGDGT